MARPNMPARLGAVAERPLAATTAKVSGETLGSQRRKEARVAYLFLLPTFLGFLLFSSGPLLASIGLSFTSYDVLSRPVAVGLDNYLELVQDERVHAGFRNTVVFVVLSGVLEMVIALLLAVLLQNRMPAGLRYYFRTAFFLPIITSSVAIAIIFSYMFSKEFGVINYYITGLGFDEVPWLTTTRWSLITVVFASVWQRLGFTFILFVAGLQNIPRELYEAAEIDGVTWWTKLLTITLPLLSPTMLFVGVIGLINGLQVFDLPYIMTSGGPGDSSRTVVMLIQEEAFQNLRFGYGSAIAVLLFLGIMFLTLVQFWLSRRWVHYR